MDKSEVIILSSDDESETRQIQKLMPRVTVKRISAKSVKNPKTSGSDNTPSQPDTSQRKRKNGGVTITSSKKQCQNVGKENPEVVVLEECLDKKQNDKVQEDCGSNAATEHVQSNLKLEVINLDTAEDDSKKKVVFDKGNTVIPKVKALDKKQKESSEAPSLYSPNPRTDLKKNKRERNLRSFTEFVEFCGSLESIATDRIRLTKKLMKRFDDADPAYVESSEFENLIQKSREKVNEHNLYLIAKDVAAELSFRKLIEVADVEVENVQSGKKFKVEDVQVENDEKTVAVQEKGGKKLKKRAKFLKKIFNKLEEMGNKIRELEEEEVDLSDEENSSYVRLQRYRERYCMIYKKLCKYTNEIPDIAHLSNPKICFAESKYPTINKCIEVWLNKVKRFPDFTDIMKLLESQSASLGLPSNRESLRPIAVEIFQQVGSMLQRRRKYDLWDSFCGFLGDQIDPAVSDPVLEKVLKDNFEARMKKEQEIFQHYTELQEKEKLEPEEVPEEEANCSPAESGNEDDQEIEEIENNILRRLDSDMEEGAEKEGDVKTQSDSAEEPEQEQMPGSSERKESKNNYKNCKSMKWRSENSGKSKIESDNSENSDALQEREEGKADVSGSNEDPTIAKESDKNDSDLELLAEETHRGANPEKEVGNGAKAGSDDRIPLKRSASPENKFPVKKKYTKDWENEENESCSKSNDSFEVKFCQVFADNVFESFGEKKQDDGKKRKVFRDMTNVNRLMKLHGKSMHASGWFAPSFFRPMFRDPEKPSWKRRFKVSFRMVGSGAEKCARSQEEGEGEKIKFDEGRESNEKNIQDNSGRGGNGGDGFYGGRGGESHEDGDEDRNRKNGKTDNERTESKPEEEEEDEDDKDEGETETRTEETEYSQLKIKTEETEETNEKTVCPLEVLPSDEKTNALNLSKMHANDINPEKTPEHILEIKEEIVNSEELNEEANKLLLNEFFYEKSNGQDAEQYSQMKLKNGKSEKESSPRVQENSRAETDELVVVEKLNAIGSTVQRCQPKRRSLPAVIEIENENKNEKQMQDRTVAPRRSLPVQILREKLLRKKKSSDSDEERVKRFLTHSPSSISITPPRKLALSKPPSDAVLRALESLRRLKDISATIVKGRPKKEDNRPKNEGSRPKNEGNRPKNEGNRPKKEGSRPKNEDDVMVIGGYCRKPARRNNSQLHPNPGDQNNYPTPKIVTVVGNVTGFENYPQEMTHSENNWSPLRISNVWGNTPDSFIQSVPDNEAVEPGCSRENFRQSNSQHVRKKSRKKEVEYVVLE